MVEIISATEEDLSEILELQRIAFKEEAELLDNFEIQPMIQTLDELIDEFHKGIILKAVLDDKIIGSVRAYAEGDTVYIGKLMVHPDNRGEGLGKRLLSSIEEEFVCNRFELFTTVHSEKNLRLYEEAKYVRFKEETDVDDISYVYLEKRVKSGSNISYGISLGLIFGVVLGMLTDNLALWLSIGLCLGVAVSSVPFQAKIKPKK